MITDRVHAVMTRFIKNHIINVKAGVHVEATRQEVAYIQRVTDADIDDNSSLPVVSRRVTSLHNQPM